MAEKKDLPDLHEKQFSISGNVDMLTGVHNALSFVLTERKKIEALFDDGPELFSCEHCNVNMIAVLAVVHDIIRGAIAEQKTNAPEEKKEEHRVN